MDETYGTYVDVECFDIHDYDDDTDHDTDHDTDDDADGDTDTDDAEHLMVRRRRDFFYIFSVFIILFDQMFFVFLGVGSFLI